MKKPSDWENVKSTTDRVQLPVGAYICKIMGAKEVTYNGSNGEFSRLEVSFDIAEGEYAGFYADDYRSQNIEDKKWKGVLRQYIPADDGSEQDNRTKGYFKAMTEAVEESNPGYHWDWNPDSLKGKTVGCVFQNKEWEFGNRSGWKAQPYKFTTVDKVKNNKYKIPKEKPLSNKSAASVGGTGSFVEIEDDNGDLPF